METWTDRFLWYTAEPNDENTSAQARYRGLVRWAGEARGKNPEAFDALTEWLSEDAAWTDESLAENEAVFLHGVLERFQAQNALLLRLLRALEKTEPVNPAVYPALERFNTALSGAVPDEQMQQAVTAMRADFSSMRVRQVRKWIAGEKTGPAGVNHVELYGYVNLLKDCDAAVQWALFMPDLIEKQQDGFRMTHFAYKKMPAMRFVGREECGGPMKAADRRALFCALDALDTYRSEFSYDLFLMHHNGQAVDVGAWHGFFGRFMQPDTPVPDGFVSFDFVPIDDGRAGAPFVSQFAFAVFSGDDAALHRREGFDSDAMYDVTRNTMLAQDVLIPYPEKYWTAEVFLNGHAQGGTAYLFSAAL